jgi:hypothetical protein
MLGTFGFTIPEGYQLVTGLHDIDIAEESSLLAVLVPIGHERDHLQTTQTGFCFCSGVYPSGPTADDYGALWEPSDILLDHFEVWEVPGTNDGDLHNFRPFIWTIT